MKRQPSVVIMMPNYNSASILYRNKSLLEQCLKSLKRTKYGNYRVLVADNSSTDQSGRIAKRLGAEFLVKRTKEDYGGIPKTNNFAIKYIMKRYDPDYILMFNTDMLVNDPYWLKKLVETAESDKKIGLVGCKLVYPTGKIQHAGMIIDSAPRNRGRAEPDDSQYDEVEDVDGVTAALQLMPNAMIKKVGLFDENFRNGFDDTDYCLRVRRAGFRIVYDGRAEVLHLEGFASANSPDQSTRDRSFYGYQFSYVYFAYKNLGFLGRIKVICTELLRSVISVEDASRERKAANIMLRDRKLWRIKVSIRAIGEARRTYLANKS